MKKTLLAAIIVIGIATNANAQLTPNKTFLGGFAGATMYTTYGGGNSFRFGVEIGQNSSTDISVVGNLGAIMEKYTKAYEISGNVRAFVPGNSTVKFFGEIGAGAYIFRYSYYQSSSSNTYLGLNVGMGGKVALEGNVDLIIKAKFHNVFAQGGGSNWINLTAGVNFEL